MHNNLIRNCGTGISGGRATSRVAEVIDATTFAAAHRTLPLDDRSSSQCRGWQLVWRRGRRETGRSIIEAVTGAAKPETVRFTLTAPREMKAGDDFELLPPAMNWQLHSNTIADCLRPVILDGYGGPTSVFRDNVLTRDATAGVEQGIEVRGRFQLLGNCIVGFDEPGCAALSLNPDPSGNAVRCLIRRNVFERCTLPVRESQEGLWAAATARGNDFIDCGTAPAQAAAPATSDSSLVPELVETREPVVPVLTAPPAERAPVVDGAVAEWPWQDAARVVDIARTPQGGLTTARAHACATWAGQHLYVAIRVPIAEGTALRGGTDFATCDGVEVSYRTAGVSGPIQVLWGSCNGAWQPLPAGGATPEQRAAMTAAVSYAARATATEWTCEWRIPLTRTADAQAQPQKLSFNIGLHRTSTDAWIAWVATGGAFYEVDNAGELVLGK